MKYEQIARINPALARQLARKATPPGCAYWCAGVRYETKYKAVNK